MPSKHSNILSIPFGIGKAFIVGLTAILMTPLGSQQTSPTLTTNQNGASSTPGDPCSFASGLPSGTKTTQQDGRKGEVIYRGRSGRAEDYPWLVL
jgi:hypothetical protein